jgi:hypothetical protein
VRRANFGFQPMLRKRSGYARRAIVRVGSVGKVLQLAPATPGKQPAWRKLTAGSGLYRSIIQQDIAGNCKWDMATAGRNSISAGRDPDNCIAHKSASVAGMAFTRSSAIIPGPAASAARP